MNRIGNPSLFNLPPSNSRLDELSRLQDGWDGEDAPRPSSDAIRRANGVIRWAAINRVRTSYIDSDVLGGVAIFVHGQSIHRDREVWFSIKNDNQDTLVASAGDAVVWHAMLTADSVARAAAFLKGE